ncbi:MAG: hypothetical protein PHW03_02880 [Eubacteriales bacterium]|nr:hypothetical protein [Eubacteriales bacterium]
MNMKETNLLKTKKQIIRHIWDTFIDLIHTDSETYKNGSIDECVNELIHEYQYALWSIIKVSNAKRMREVNTVVRNYFGFETAQEFLDEVTETKKEQ